MAYSGPVEEGSSTAVPTENMDGASDDVAMDLHHAHEGQ